MSDKIAELHDRVDGVVDELSQGQPVDIFSLQRLTEESRAERAEAERIEAEREQVEREKELSAQRAKAEVIIAQIPARAKEDARATRNYSIIMSISSDDYNRPFNSPEPWDSCQPDWLTGTAEIVWKYCFKQGLSPTLEFWHDGVGVNSGFNIVIHW